MESVGRSSRMDVMMLSDGVGSTVSDTTSIISSELESDGKSSAMSDMKVMVGVFLIEAVVVLNTLLLELMVKPNTLLEAMVAAPTTSESDSLLNMVELVDVCF